MIFSVLPFVGMSFLPTAFAGDECSYGTNPLTGNCWCTPPPGFTGITTIINGICDDRPMVGGDMIPIDSTMVLVAGTQTTAAWMIPAIVSAIGIGIVIARKF